MNTYETVTTTTTMMTIQMYPHFRFKSVTSWIPWIQRKKAKLQAVQYQRANGSKREIWSSENKRERRKKGQFRVNVSVRRCVRACVCDKYLKT